MNFQISAWIVALSWISFRSFLFTVQQFQEQTRHLYVKLISTIPARGGNGRNQRSMDVGYTREKSRYELQKKKEKRKKEKKRNISAMIDDRKEEMIKEGIKNINKMKCQSTF